MPVPPRPDPTIERPGQILEAAFVCFSRKGFHQTTMQDIAAEAGISVGLIYRYFENKEAVITALAEDHKKDLQEVFREAHEAGSLQTALEILFTRPCGELPREVESIVVIDLFAESARHPVVARLMSEIKELYLSGMSELIAAAPEAEEILKIHSPRRVAEMLCTFSHGRMTMDILTHAQFSVEENARRRLEFLQAFWNLLFSHRAVASAVTPGE